MRSVARSLAVAALSANAWLGCNALLGNENAVFDPDAAAIADGNARDGAGGSDAQDENRVDGDVDPDAGPCVDTQTNREHCGRCNHSCLGGDCVGGRCQPVVLVRDERGPSVISVDGTHVYWINGRTGDIRRALLDGGAKELLFDGPADVAGDALIVHGTGIYFALPVPDGGVFSCPKNGCTGAPQKVVGPLESPSSVFITPAGELSFTELAVSGRVGRCNLPCNGGIFVEVASGQGFASHVAAASGGVFWKTITPEPGVRGREGTGPVLTLATGPVEQIVATPDEVFFAEPGLGPRVYARDGGTIRRIRTSDTQSLYLALTATEVFFTEGFRGNVYGCPRSGCLDGGPPIATNQESPRGITADDSAVYWVNDGVVDGGGAVMRLAR